MSHIADLARGGHIFLADGAWGTMLQERGLAPGECTERWVLTRPDDVRDIARQYVDAGAELVKTNTLGGTSIRLAHYGLADQTARINEAAAALSKEAAGGRALVIASMGPSGEMLITGDVTEDELYEAFAEQARALGRGGTDAVCIETFSDPEEAAIAIRAVKEATGLEVLCTFTFEKTEHRGYRTLTGATPSGAALAALDAGADIVGTNCGSGIALMVDIVHEIREATHAPILVGANAGLPVTEGGRTVFPETPEYMASFVPALLEAGANIIGGCCGTTPAHIRAFARTLAGCRG